jgi:mRNA interferase HicA
MKRVDLIRHLERQGCELKREGGEHSIYRNPATNRQTSVPRHREIRETLVKLICKQLEIDLPG